MTMGVVSVKELFRKNIYEVGKSRQLTREFVLVLSDDALTNPMNEGSPFAQFLIPNVATKTQRHLHPTYTSYACRKVTYTEGYEGSPYHVHVVAEYGIVTANELEAPVDRAAVWEFASAPGEVPALYYYDGSGNGTLRPLTNSAYDYFQGLTTQESLITAKVTKNFATLPTSWISAQNFVNDSTYLNCAEHTWKVARVNVVQSQEEFGGTVTRYWQAVAELQYRQSGHNYQLPDVGFNFIGGGQKRRCMVFDFQNDEWIPSPNPVGLDGNGNQTGGAPAILNRRVNPVADFQALFGAPPTTPLTL